MFEMNCRVLNYEKRDYVNKDGRDKTFVSALLRAGGKTFECSSEVDLSKQLDQEVDLIFDIKVFQGKATGVSVVKIV